MCDKETDDLINLSIEENDVAKSNYILPLPLLEVQPNSPEPRLSLDNNPFDLVQKLAICRQDDPFEVVEKEASLKAQMSLSKVNNDVKTGNLLSLSGDNSDVTNFDSANFSVFSNSTIYESAEVNDLESESPPITMSTKLTPESSTAESGGCTQDSSDSGKKQGTNTRNRKLRQLRHRLLKMSVSNSTYNTPMSSIKTAYNDDEQMIAAESPIKSMFDDLLTEQQPSETIYTEKDFDDDLEKMQIPMLNQMRSPIDQINSSNHDKRELNTIDIQEASSNDSKLPDLESIRLKLSAKRSENNRHDINDLINNLKTLICQSHAVDEEKKHQVNNLLETLSSTLNTASTECKENLGQPITRQGTFNCDLEENNDKLIEIDKAIGSIEQPTVDEMPDIMMRSSATYDGDTTEDKEHLNLPQIDPPSPSKEHQQHDQPIISEFMEQLQYFLEQQQSNASKQHETCKSTQANGQSAATNNPTFIVVLNTMNTHEENNDFSAYNQNSNGMRRRSQSLSLHDKMKFVQIPVKSSVEINTTETFDSEEITPPLDTTEGSDFKTPARFFQRRNSFSSGTPHSPMRYSRFSNLPLDKNRSNSSQFISQSIPTSARRLSIMDTHTESQLTQTLLRPKLEIIKPDLKRKVKASTGVVISNEPMKATLPLKNFTSSIKTKTQTIASNTSLHLVAKSGHMSNTSTPMPELRTNILKVKGKAMPSPGKLSAAHTARLSNLSTTPIGKSLGGPTASAVGYRRRTLSEFKPKSPMKTRSSAASSGLNSGGTLPKVNLTKLRPSSYLKGTTNRRTSLYESSAHLANRNKENN